MGSTSNLPLALGLIIFSFLINSLLVVPFINLLYKLRLTRRKEAQKGKAVSTFDKLHDVKAGTPIGGGILIVSSVVVLFFAIFYFASYMGVLIRSAYSLRVELFVIFFTFLSFGFLGLTDDVKKIFGKGRAGRFGFSYGLTQKQKFVAQWVLAFIIGFLMYHYLGIKILHIPFVQINLNPWGMVYTVFCFSYRYFCKRI